jgi:hypothetical protein
MIHPRTSLLIPAAIALLIALALAAFATDFEWISSGGRGHVRTNSQGSVMSRALYTNAAVIMPGGGLGFLGTNDALRNYASSRSPISVATNLSVVWTNSSYMLFPSSLSEMRYIATSVYAGITISADLINPYTNRGFKIACDLLACPDWASNGTDTTTINILTNGEFDATNGWTTNAGWTISNSAAWYAGTGGVALAQTVAGLPTGPYGTNWWYTWGATITVSGAACTLQCKLGGQTVTVTPPCQVQVSLTNAAASATWSLVPIVPTGTTTLQVDNAYLVPCVPRQFYSYPIQSRQGSDISSTPTGDISQNWDRVTCVIAPASTSIAWYVNAILYTNHVAPVSNSIPAGSFWSLSLSSLSPNNLRGVRNWFVFNNSMSSNQVSEFSLWLDR